MIKVLVMSDLHLGPEGRVKYGLDTAQRFSSALEDAARLYGDADLCVFAGDIADKGEAEAYQRFDEMRSEFKIPQAVLLGNHDDRETYLRVAQEPMTNGTHHVQGRRDIGDVRLLLLDSSEPGRVEGVLDQARLEWLRDELATAKAESKPVLIITHHHPQRLHMPVDRYKLTAPETLREVLDASGARIDLILAGHCHIPTAGNWYGYSVATISGNQHRVSPFLPGMTGQQTSYEGPAQFAVILHDGEECVVHFHNYVDRNIALPDAMFPWKYDQWEHIPHFLRKTATYN